MAVLFPDKPRETALNRPQMPLCWPCDPGLEQSCQAFCSQPPIQSLGCQPGCPHLDDSSLVNTRSTPACLFSHAPSPRWPELSRHSQELAWCPSAWRCNWAPTQLFKQVPYGPPGRPSFPFPTLTVSEIKIPSWLSANGCREGPPCCFGGLSWCGIVISRLAGGDRVPGLQGEGLWKGAGGPSVGETSVCPLGPAAAPGAVTQCQALVLGP